MGLCASEKSAHMPPLLLWILFSKSIEHEVEACKNDS